jgi:hypothetical protein
MGATGCAATEGRQYHGEWVNMLEDILFLIISRRWLQPMQCLWLIVFAALQSPRCPNLSCLAEANLQLSQAPVRFHGNHYRL